MPADMREPDYPSGTEELIAKGRHLDAALERFGDHGINLSLGRPCAAAVAPGPSRSDQYRA